MKKITEADPERNQDSDIFRQSIQHLSCEEFDGHTDFVLLSPEDKLHWLSEVARFFYDNQKGPNRNE